MKLPDKLPENIVEDGDSCTIYPSKRKIKKTIISLIISTNLFVATLLWIGHPVTLDSPFIIFCIIITYAVGALLCYSYIRMLRKLPPPIILNYRGIRGIGYFYTGGFIHWKYISLMRRPYRNSSEIAFYNQKGKILTTFYIWDVYADRTIFIALCEKYAQKKLYESKLYNPLFKRK